MSLDYSHVIIGAGSVGLAIASRLARAGYSSLLVEKNAEVGAETSSRNSEVVHAGLYYPPESLKMQLCLRGKELIYNTKELKPYVKKCGKWLVSQNAKESQYLEKLRNIAKTTHVPLNYISLTKAEQLEPAVIAREAILESPTTGIMSAHALMQYYESLLVDDNSGGETSLALLTEVNGIEKVGNTFEVKCSSQGEELVVKSAAVINSAGLWAPRIAQMLGLPYTGYFAKGNYFSYASSHPKVGRLVYPCPSDEGSLGTHLTIDLSGGIKFGPDFEWVDSPAAYKVSEKNLEAAKTAIRRYMDIDTTKLVPDYSGIRPKLSKDTTKFRDFHIKEEIPGFINLMGIESPGLTSSMAVAEYVTTMF